MPLERLRIATRKSPLAMWQAEYVRDRLKFFYPKLRIELVSMSTRGDVMQEAPLAKIGGKGLFVKELEQALLDGRADIAVHSMKDVPMEFPEGLGLAAICERETPTDAFVSNNYRSLNELPAGARVGTSSLRRQCQIRARFKELKVIDLRGNVNTRLGRLDQGDFDAIILASAGLVRLGLEQRITSRLSPDESLPAGGQGAVGIESRVRDRSVNELLKALHHPSTAVCITAERSMNRRLEGGCQVPIASLAEILPDGQLRLRGLVGSPDGERILRSEIVGSADRAEQLGVRLAETLLDMGAGEILDDVYRQA